MCLCGITEDDDWATRHGDMALVITIGSVWMLLAAPAAMVLGRVVRTADERAEAPFSTAGVERYLREQASAPLA